MKKIYKLKNICVWLSLIIALLLFLWEKSALELYRENMNVPLFYSNDGMILLAYFEQYYYFVISFGLSGLVQKVFLRKEVFMHINIILNKLSSLYLICKCIFILIIGYLITFYLNYYLNYNFALLYSIGDMIKQIPDIFYFLFCFVINYEILNIKVKGDNNK